MMARDIDFIRKAIKLMPPISLKGMADFDLVLDELWSVTRDEMNFLTEAANIEEFAEETRMSISFRHRFCISSIRPFMCW